MDRANENSMITIDVNINTNLSFSSQPRLVYRYAHGYDYTPQFWGYWDVEYGPNMLGPSGERVTRRGYGYITFSTAVAVLANFYYKVDSSYVELYFLYDSQFTDTGRFSAGTKATFTGYLFANDRVNQKY